ncbi:translation protein SH3-like domain-containing protein [Blastocladiella britannica]|nr:translation protein SH3-like domain-containing protein [Blastocladiella britannica]
MSRPAAAALVARHFSTARTAAPVLRSALTTAATGAMAASLPSSLLLAGSSVINNTTTGNSMSTLVRIQQTAANVAHYDVDGRSALFTKTNPDRIRAGSVVQVTSLTSMTKGKPVMFAGVVIAIRHKGIDTSLTLRNYVLKTGVEQAYKVYSPMVTSIKVLKPQTAFVRNKLYYLRDNPKLFKWGAIDDLVKSEALRVAVADGTAVAAKSGGKKDGKGKGKGRR